MNAPTDGAAWKRINRKRLPKTGIIIAGSWRNDGCGGLEWTMSSPCDYGFGNWFDADRTHYIRLPKPPSAPAKE
jgi:hypothetical protein